MTPSAPAPAPRPSEREIAERITDRHGDFEWGYTPNGADACRKSLAEAIEAALTEARRAAIEEALRICDEYGDSPDVLSAAQAIRSLASPSPGKGGGG